MTLFFICFIKFGVFMINFTKNLILETVRKEFNNENISLQFKLSAKKDDNYDLAVLSFPAAKDLRVAPPEAGKLIGRAIESADIDVIERVEVVGPFVNVTFDRKVIKALLWKSFCNGVSHPYPASDKTVVVEYSSPNIAKPIGFHHIRSTVIGEVVSRIYSAIGWKTVRINYLGDWGIQFGKVLAAYELWGENKEIDNVDALFEFYTRYHREEENIPELRQMADKWFKMLENGDKDALKLWEKFRNVSITAFKDIYERLDIEYDFFTGEGDYYLKGKELTKKLMGLGVAEISEGAKVININEKIPPLILEKSDGTTIYATRDMAAAVDRFERFKFDRMCYVVGSDQKLHFTQLFSALKKAGEVFADRLKHIDFGLVLMNEGKMSTRQGNLVTLTDVLDKGKELMLEQIKEKNPDMVDKDSTAESVSKAAIFFSTLSKKRSVNITFNWDEMLSFSGESGPYLQYSYVRACSILRKFEADGGKVEDIYKTEFKSVPDEDEASLLTGFYSLFNEIERAATDEEPYIVVEKALSMAQDFNKFYYTSPVLKSENRNELLASVILFKKVMEFVLPILGIDLLEEM